MQIAVTRTAEKLVPEFNTSQGRSGFVCAQANPLLAGDRDCMRAMAKRFHAWAPNIAVKLPATSAGLDVLEDCVAEGITITATVSFTVPQVVAIAERHRTGIQRAQANGVAPGKCFAVIVIGRLDDYLREVAQNNRAAAAEGDIRQAGLAILGVNAIQLKPVRREGRVEFIDSIGLSLTCDHQAIDGAPGARFLQVLKGKIENVESLCTI